MRYHTGENSTLHQSTFYIDLIYHLILEHTLRRNHISEPKVAKRLHMLVHLYSIQEHMQGKRLMKCRQCVANVTKLSVGIVIYEIILECIQENNTWTKRKIDEIYLYISVIIHGGLQDLFYRFLGSFWAIKDLQLVRGLNIRFCTLKRVYKES